jgi:uncharacterized protein DUF4386
VSSPIQTVLGTATTTSLKRLARIAGVFYLFVAVFGGFSQGVAPALLYVAGDAAATAGNVVANPALVPVVVVAHLINAVFFVLTTVALYLLLGHVHKRVAGVMVIAVVLAAGIIAVSDVLAFAASRVATDATYVAAFGAPEPTPWSCSCSASSTTASSPRRSSSRRSSPKSGCWATCS